MRLLSWIDPAKLDGKGLSCNPNAIDYLEAHPEMIDWKYNIWTNTNAMHLLDSRPKNKKVLYCLSQNPSAVSWFEKNPSKLDQEGWWRNPAAWYKNAPFPRGIGFLYEIAEIPEAIDVIRKNKVRMGYCPPLFSNPAAIDLIEERINGEIPVRELEWLYLLKNPAAIHIIEERWDHLRRLKECWTMLSKNPAAIHILKANQDKISWSHLSCNPAIFEPEVPVFKQELIETVFHPLRVFEKMGGPEWLECM
jgi:hypothetical protein